MTLLMKATKSVAMKKGAIKKASAMKAMKPVAMKKGAIKKASAMKAMKPVAVKKGALKKVSAMKAMKNGTKKGAMKKAIAMKAMRKGSDSNGGKGYDDGKGDGQLFVDSDEFAELQHRLQQLYTTQDFRVLPASPQ